MKLTKRHEGREGQAGLAPYRNINRITTIGIITGVLVAGSAAAFAQQDQPQTQQQGLRDTATGADNARAFTRKSH